MEKNVYEYFITFIWKLSLTGKYKEVLLLSMLRQELTVIFSQWEPMQGIQIFFDIPLFPLVAKMKKAYCVYCWSKHILDSSNATILQMLRSFFKWTIDNTFGNFMWERFPFCLLEAFYKASFLRGIIYHSLQFFPPLNLLVSPCGGI